MDSEMKKTLVIGASTNEARYSNRCVQTLNLHKVPVIAIGLRSGYIGNTAILTSHSALTDIHTVTLYVGKANQVNYYDYILNLKPKRVIFNPGAENPEFEALLTNAGIEVEEACTIVMLQSGVF